jgi:hypothetical protein
MAQPDPGFAMRERGRACNPVIMAPAVSNSVA